MAKLSRQHIKQYFVKYSTTPTVTVYNPTVAILYFTLVITAFCMYFASIEFKLQKLYQRECPVQGTTLVSILKGRALVSSENIVGRPDIPASYRRKWDIEELVFPAYGGEGDTGSFTVVTNMEIIENQTRSRCTHEVLPTCEQDDDCKEGVINPYGVLTGKCIQDARTCEMEGWCPPDADNATRLKFLDKPLLADVKNLTVLLRSIVEFPKCGAQQGHNTLYDELPHCMYDPVEHPLCPLFQIGDLVNRSNVDFTEAAIFGCVFRIRMKWDCDFDFGWTAQDCKPTYSVSVVPREYYGGTTIWRFELPLYHPDGRRTYRRMFALKFLIHVEGKGRQFHFFTFIINLGASTGLLFVAPFVCDLILSVYDKFVSSSSTKTANKGEEFALDKGTSESTVVPMEQKKY